MRSIAQCLPPLPGLAGPRTYAAWPIWRDSTTAELRFAPMPKRQASRLYHKARRFERQTRQPGRQDGALGRNGLAVLHALLFDFLNYATGRLDPGYQAIARQACISVRSVARGLKSLKSCGVLNWLRRCGPTLKDGRFVLEQDTNAYSVLPASQWLGFIEPPPVPPPQPGTWGDHPPLPSTIAQAAADRAAGTSPQGVLAVLESDEADPLAFALARFGRALFRAKP